MSKSHSAHAATLRNEGALRVLENDALRVTLAPARGGKIISLFSKRTETEWLLPPLRAYEDATSAGGFEQWDGGGFDECLPTVAATNTAPDHGELWRIAWEEEAEGAALILRAVACGDSILLQRQASLGDSALILNYTLENLSSAPRSLLYSAHPLLRVEQGDRIELPSSVEYVTVEGSRGERLGKQGDRIGWPRPGSGHATDLSVVGPPDGQHADKLFAGPLDSGWCRLLRPSLNEALEVSFDPSVLPYLGLWICHAAWPEGNQPGARKQYTVAFEPTGANCDSLADAERNGTAWRLAPDERRTWSLRFAVVADRIEGKP